jgi:hypothetical protein
MKSYLSTKPIDSYPKTLIKDMYMISFFPDEMATPFGSYIYKMQKYPGDVDLLQEFKECCTVDQVINKFIKELHRVVKDILSSKMHYFSEFKAGLDHNYDIDIGFLKNGIYHYGDNLKDKSLILFQKKLFNQEEISKIIYIIDNNITNGDAYDIIYNIYRERRILRWTAKEILQSFKIVNGKPKTLYESLFDETHVKIDMIALNNGRFIEITNFVGLTLDDGSGNLEYINIDLKENHDIKIQLPVEIEKLYFSNYYYSPFKMLKRVFSLSRNKRDNAILEKVIPIVSGDISLLYQIKSEIEVILRIFEITNNPPLKTIITELDNMKNRISTVLLIDDAKQEKIYEVLDKIIYEVLDKKNIVTLLELLNKLYFKPLINFNTIIELEKVKLNPPTANLLPPIISYALITRSPYDSPNVNEIFF